MNARNWQRLFIRLGLILTLTLSTGLLTACDSGGDGGGGAPVQADPAQEKSWDKLVWDTGKWG